MAARIQVQREARRGEIIEVRILIQHPVETGFRYDAFGRQTPRNVIYSLECRYGGTEGLRAPIGAGIDDNPYPSFCCGGTSPVGIKVRWYYQENTLDNRYRVRKSR